MRHKIPTQFGLNSIQLKLSENFEKLKRIKGRDGLLDELLLTVERLCSTLMLNYTGQKGSIRRV